jgi:aryl-alcohol dehydrogenase-like predicted oxidoreductase
MTMRSPKQRRREFIKGVTLGAAAAGVLVPLLNENATATAAGEMPYRPLGRTGEKVSLLGLGGAHFGMMMPDEEYATRFIRTAIDDGVNFVETSWDYDWGLSEYRIGKALRDGYRQKAFLATKIDGRTKPSAEWQLDDSLHRLRTDTIDLVQFHEVVNMSDPDRIFGPNGAIETLLAAKKAGKIRYIGFTSHWGPDVILKTINLGLKNGFTFDTAMVTLNVMDPHFRNVAGEVVPVLQELGVGVLAFKSMGAGGFVGKKDYSEAKDYDLKPINVAPVECLHYVMSLPVSVVISGMNTMEILRENLKITREFRQMSDAQIAQLLARTAEAGRSGQYEWWKTPKGREWTRDHPECFS